MVMLFSATIFLSAFLLFWIQPLFAKMALPLLGGAPAVWNTAMVFYQTALLAGYAYAHFSVQKFGLRRQIAIHLAFLIIPAIALPIAVSRFGMPTGTENPALWMLKTMAFTVGLPYLVVSATSPLVQRWFSATGHPSAKDPYFLYAASNAGSMLALILFPLALEPNFSADLQATLWGWGYIVLAGLLVVCGLTSRKMVTLIEVDASLSLAIKQPLSWLRRLRWIALAAVPCSLMLGVTTYATTDIAAVPMFWVAPLALYLLTFILVFAARPPIPHRFCVAMMPVLLVALVLTLAFPIERPASLILSLHLVTFFFTAMVCHGELAKDRPSAAQLTEFYLLMSVGGALGGAFNALIAPAIFVFPIEYSLVLILSGLFLPRRDWATGLKPWIKDTVTPFATAGIIGGAVLLERNYGLTSSLQARMFILAAGALCCLLWTPRPWRFAGALGAFLIIGRWQDVDPRHLLFAGRSFFGVHKVLELPGSGVRNLLHGRITHGTQNFKPGLENVAQSYYVRSGPFGKLITSLDLPKDARVGVLGLGVGSVVSYSKPGQHWTFFEIDPVVVRIATDPKLFTYVTNAKGKVDVVLGDGRLTIARADGKFDLIVLDAFTSDAVPVHLLTREAFEMYRSKLKPGGAIIVNITNKHLDLEPLIGIQAQSLAMTAYIGRDWHLKGEDRRNGKAASSWAVMAPSRSTLAHLSKDIKWMKAPLSDRVALWTDDHSSILSVLTSL